MTELTIEGPGTPLPVLGALKDLWEAGFRTETRAFEYGSFRLLVQNCLAVYPGISESRLAEYERGDIDLHALQEALRNFFRWTGAPWYSQRGCPSPDDAAARLHAAFLLRKVRRKYVVPLDRLGLEDTTGTPPGELRRLTFGPCEVAILDDAEFAAHVHADALARFGERYRLDLQRFAKFYYLVTTVEEQAGPIWKRGGGPSLLRRTPLDSPLLSPRLYEAIYPEAVGSAILTMLLCFAKDPRDAHGEPFAVPWVYSVTDDPFSHPADNSISDDLFARPQRAPDPSSLTWESSPTYEEHKAPDRGWEPLEFRKEDIEKDLEETWDKLQAALDSRQLHPLAKHFFLKGFRDKGIDQINSNLSCLEATLMLAHESYGKDKMFQRYQHLVRDETCCEWLKRSYDLRDKYLHSLGASEEKFTWEDLARTRYAVTRAVDKYLDLAGRHSDKSRKTILRSLNQQPD